MSSRPNRDTPPPPGTVKAARVARPKFKISIEEFLALLQESGLEDFADLSSWSSWVVLLKALLGEPLSPEEEAVFRLYTGRTRVLPRYSEVICISGRQSGKSRIATLLAVYYSVMAKRTQTVRSISLVSQDHQAAKAVLLSYIRSLFALPSLRAMVASQKAGEISTKSNRTLRTYPCDPAAVRGPKNDIALIDEIGFLRSREGVPMSLPMLRALRPNTDLIVALSSSMVEGSPVDLLCSEHYGVDDSPILVWRSSTEQMNPTYDRTKLGQIRAYDPEGFAEEFEGQAMKRAARFLDRSVVLAAVDRNTYERPPKSQTSYSICLDSSQRQEDSFIVTVFHAERDQYGMLAIQDFVQEFLPVKKGQDPELKKIAATIKFLRRVYPGPNVVYGDSANLHYISSDLAPELKCLAAQIRNPATSLEQAYDADANLVRATTNQALSRARTAFLQGRVRLLDEGRSIQQWCALVMKRSPSGSIRIEAPAGMHDDHPSAAALAIALLVENSTQAAPAVSSGPGYLSPAYVLPVGQSQAWSQPRGPLTRKQREDLLADRLSKQLENDRVKRENRINGTSLRLPHPEIEPKTDVDIFSGKPISQVIGRALNPRRQKSWFPPSWRGDGSSGVS